MGTDSEDFHPDNPEPDDFSPRRSVAHKLLLDAAEANGIDRSQVRELLWLINAPPEIGDISNVLTSLAEVLDGAEAQWPGILHLQILEWMPDVIRKLLTEVAKIRTSLQAKVQDSSGRWLERNALYASLRKSPSWSRELLARYRLLQAHYFFAHTAWLVRNDSNSLTPTSISAYETYGGKSWWPALRFDPYDPGLCIRHMLENEASEWASEFLTKLPLTLTPRQLPANSAVRMESRMKKDEYSVQRAVNYISDYLQHVYGIKEQRAGHGSSPGPQLGSEIGDTDDPYLNFGYMWDWERGSDLPLDVPPLVLPPISSSSVPELPLPLEPPAGLSVSSEQDPESKEDDEVPSDEDFDEDDSESYGGSLDCEDSEYSKSPGSFSGRVNGAIHQVIRQQKMFPFGIERLSAGELIQFGELGNELTAGSLQGLLHSRRKANESLRRRTQSGLTAMEEAEARLFVAIMVGTGSGPERAAGLMVAKSENYLQDEPLAVVIPDRIASYQATLRIRVPFPDYKRTQDPVPGSDCVRTEYLSLRTFLGTAIVAYSRIHQLNGDTYRLFHRPVDCLKANAQTLLRTWDPSGRLTLKKLSWTLFGRVMEVTGNDAVAATMITGNKHRLSKVAMHYACRDVSVIQNIHHEAIVRLWSEIRLAWSNDLTGSGERFRENDPALSTKYEGKASDTVFLARRLCPQSGVIRQVFRDLIRDLKENKPYRPSSDQAWIAYHNLYTFYTVWVFAMATGVRKIVTPYLSAVEISPLNQVAMLRDKDGDSGVKAKLVWIPELVLKQMKYYAEHLAYIRERFNAEDETLPCFFLSEKGCMKLVRPKSMYTYVSEYLPGFQVDIHRRFMFNLLLDTGGPPEVVRIWMGHAVAGEEWWSEHATFSHQEYRVQLRKYLVPILDFLEIEEIQGATSRNRVRREALIHA